MIWLGALLLGGLAALPLSTAWGLAPDLGHGWGAPLLMAYLWWERWGERPTPRPRPVSWKWWTLAAAAVAAALPLRLLLTPFPLWPTLVWAYVLLLAGLGLAAAGLLAGRPGVRWVGGPLIVLAAALPWGTVLEQHLVQPLRVGMAMVTAEVSNLLGRPAIAVGTGVRLGSAWVGIDEACGGIRSLEASVMLALFMGEWLLLSWKRRGALVGLGVFAALLGNLLRILFLSLCAGRSTAAFFAAHDTAGWLALAFSLTLTGLAARRWTRGRAATAARRIPSPAGRVRGTRSAAAWLLAVAVLLALEEAGVRAWYAHGGEAQAPIPHWTALLPTHAPDFLAVPLSEEAREMLLPDRYTAGSWGIGINEAASVFYIEWRKGQVARFVPFLHNPTVCLPLAGCELEESLGDVIVPWAGGEIPFHTYIFRRAGERLTVAFAVWDSARGRPLQKAADTSDWRSWFRERWSEVREARQDQPAQVLSLAISGQQGTTQLVPLLKSLIVNDP